MSALNDFVNNVKEGAYDSKTNAQRAIGVWSRHKKWANDAEVEKAKRFVEGFNFGTTSKPTAKKTAKKAAKVEAKAAKGAKKAAKKAGRRKTVEAQGAKEEAASSGSLQMSPSMVESVGDILRLIDSTVASGVRTLDALKQVQELSPNGDISNGVTEVKRALEGAAGVLNLQVVAQLSAAHIPAPQDAVVAERLQKVVEATNEMNSAASFVPPPPTAAPLPPAGPLQ